MKLFRVPIIAAAILVSGLTGAAHAQTISYAQAGALLAKSCGADINKLCPNVNLGVALRECMQSKASQVSAQCKTDFVLATSSIAAREEAQDSIIQVCARDAAQLCQGMIPQDGNLLSCLLQAEKVVSKACNAAITNAGYR